MLCQQREDGMGYEHILYERRGGVAVVTLNRPERRNALNLKLQQELAEALLEADDHAPVHCAVLRGAGPHFCAGADLGEYAATRGEQYRGRAEIDDDLW